MNSPSELHDLSLLAPSNRKRSITEQAGFLVIRLVRPEPPATLRKRQYPSLQNPPSPHARLGNDFVILGHPGVKLKIGPGTCQPEGGLGSRENRCAIPRKNRRTTAPGDSYTEQVGSIA